MSDEGAWGDMHRSGSVLTCQRKMKAAGSKISGMRIACQRVCSCALNRSMLPAACLPARSVRMSQQSSPHMQNCQAVCMQANFGHMQVSNMCCHCDAKLPQSGAWPKGSTSEKKTLGFCFQDKICVTNAQAWKTRYGKHVVPPDWMAFSPALPAYASASNRPCCPSW